MADPSEVSIDPNAYIEILRAELSQEMDKRRMYQALCLQQQHELDQLSKEDNPDAG